MTPGDILDKSIQKKVGCTCVEYTCTIYPRLIFSLTSVLEELNKILSTDKPSVGFLLLYKTGLLSIILPELTALNQVEEIEGQTHKNNFYHTLEVVDNNCPNTDDVWLCGS